MRQSLEAYGILSYVSLLPVWTKYRNVMAKVRTEVQGFCLHFLNWLSMKIAYKQMVQKM